MTATIDAAAKTENKKLFCMGASQLLCPNRANNEPFGSLKNPG
jgi:hypothetical protein